MTDDKQVREDLGYIRSVLNRAEDAENPAIIYFLWAAITFIGFAMIDFRPNLTGFYWMIAGPGGGLLSAYLGWRAGRAVGQTSAREGRDHALHWSGMMVAILLVIPLTVTGALAPNNVERVILLIVALSYFLAGVHLDRRMLLIGIALGGCYLFTVFARNLPYLWTITAAVIAASLVATGIFAAARQRREP